MPFSVGSKNCDTRGSNSKFNLCMGLLFSKIKGEVRYFSNHFSLDLDYWFCRAADSGRTLPLNAAIFSIRHWKFFFRVKKKALIS